MAMNRRELLLRGWKVGTGLLAAASGWTVYQALRPFASTSAGGRIQLGNASQFADGSAHYFHEARLYVTNAGGTYFALSQKCPHLGCRVPFCDSSGRFECPCHGSVFDLGGEYIAGPAPRGMDRYEMSEATGSALVADTSKWIEGPKRGEKKFLTPPKGPSCLKGA